MADQSDPSTTPAIIRKLATILSADVAGYSRLMAEDEEQTLLTFRAHSAVFDALVAQHRGRIFNRAGDAILAEFDSAVEAVRCATDIQSALATRNNQLPETRQVRFRIGINLGDVLLQGDDLLGDGVNLAARLQTAAVPGGICLSGSVYDQIRNKLSLSFKSLGEMNFKNIPQPVRTFSITGDGDLGTLPTPSRAGHGRIIATCAAILALLIGTAGYWIQSQHRAAPMQQATGPSPAGTTTTANPPSTSTTASTGGPLDGFYGGPICYGASTNDAARCFRAKADLEGGRIAGQWQGRDPGTTVFLTGTISAAGAAQIEMRGERSDGTRIFILDLAGKLENGRLAANGTFHNGRTATLDWHHED